VIYREIARFPSSSSSKVYTVKENEKGELSCDCRGWTMKKPGQERGCKHTREIVAHGAPTHVDQGAPEPMSAPDEPKGDPAEVVAGLMAEIEEHQGVQAGSSLHERLRQMKEGGQ